MYEGVQTVVAINFVQSFFFIFIELLQ